MTATKLGLVFLLAACSGLTSPDGTANGEPGPSNPGSESAPVPVGANPVAGAKFWVSPTSYAREQADEWRATRPDDAAHMDKIANNPHSAWFGE